MGRLTRYPDPMTCPGCYSLDLYCCWVNDGHGFQEFPHMFTGPNRRDCEQQARKAGWTLHRETSTATCPKCRRALAQEQG